MTILDTGIITLLNYGHVNVVKHYNAVPPDEPVAITVATRMEALNGRTDSLLKAADERELLIATARLQEAEAALDDFQLLHVDEEAARHFAKLRGQNGLGKMKRTDMLIACIALAHKALLVTHNTKDFNVVPGLKLADWADS